MIGKDMTKMTLPVSFNEPTSLLQRCAEDMEYADLLEVAADRIDSTERMIYVAAFAASEYASTIERVAKPFNPLLGETFEYVRPDKNYRFFMRGKPDWTETTPEKLCTQTSFVLYKPSVRSLVANILIC